MRSILWWELLWPVPAGRVRDYTAPYSPSRQLQLKAQLFQRHRNKENLLQASCKLLASKVVRALSTQLHQPGRVARNCCSVLPNHCCITRLEVRPLYRCAYKDAAVTLHWPLIVSTSHVLATHSTNKACENIKSCTLCNYYILLGSMIHADKPYYYLVTDYSQPHNSKMVYGSQIRLKYLFPSTHIKAIVTCKNR